MLKPMYSNKRQMLGSGAAELVYLLIVLFVKLAVKTAA